MKIIAAHFQEKLKINVKFIFQPAEKTLEGAKSIAGITAGSGANYNFNYMKEIPATVNNKNLTTNIKNILKNLLGSKNITDNIKPSMGGEDFALYQQQIPGTFFFLGSKIPTKEKIHPLNPPQYSINEDILKLGVTAFCGIIFSDNLD